MQYPDLQQHAAADQAALLQPTRLSLETPPSSSSSITAAAALLHMENTAINTDMIINTTAAASISSCMSTATSYIDSAPANHMPNTSATTINTTNSNLINTASSNRISNSGHETGFKEMHNTILQHHNGVLNNNTSSGLLDGGYDGLVNTAGFGSKGSGPGAGEHAGVQMDSSSCKRKRDWMNSLSILQEYNSPAAAESSSSAAGVLQQQQQQEVGGAGGMNTDGVSTGAKKSSASLLTSVRITNALYSFPAGWDQYLDLQTGETYYVNWNTRTKHCRVQCPEVQKCLAGAQHPQQQGGVGTSTHNHRKMVNRNNTDSIESWLAKLTATTSALVSNKPQFSNKPPLPPTHPFKLSKPQQHTPGLDLSCITNKPPKRLTSINPPHCALISKSDTKMDVTSTPLVTSGHFSLARQNSLPTHVSDYCSSHNPNMDLMHGSFNLSPKPYNNTNYNSDTSSSTANLDVVSTPNIDPFTFVCPNCNMLVMISSLTSQMQCPNCNHCINKWSEDTMYSPHDMPSHALLLPMEPLSKARSL